MWTVDLFADGSHQYDNFRKAVDHGSRKGRHSIQRTSPDCTERQVQWECLRRTEWNDTLEGLRGRESIEAMRPDWPAESSSQIQLVGREQNVHRRASLYDRGNLDEHRRAGRHEQE